jgi:hypothetical protein
MTSYIIPNNIELHKIIYPRLSPYIWDIIGYGGGLVAIFYYDKIGIIIYSFSFVLYGLLNIFFDICVVSFDYSNNVMPNYKNIGKYNFYITNKKYILQNKDKLINYEMVDENKLKIELSIYAGEYSFIKYALFLIYVFGITKKNYTIKDYNTFKDTIIRYV